jgi:NAD(P)-dependent dehydrogenase (short-subunit alcohol dehydrogenase family)
MITNFTGRDVPNQSGKTFFVTGANTGIGFEAAKVLAAKGGRVLLGCRNPGKGQDALARITEANSRADVELVVMDLADLASVTRAAEIVAQEPKLDVLINNAGISIRHDFLDITPEEWDRVIAVNLTGNFYVAQTVARHMMGAQGGVILNTASTNGTLGYPFYADYNASKAGVIAVTRAMALELAPRVRVNAVAPGYVLTPMQRAEYSDEMLAEVNGKLPLGRHASPEEVAGLFAFLASDDAAYLTGHIYIIDGGETVGGLASR